MTFSLTDLDKLLNTIKKELLLYKPKGLQTNTFCYENKVYSLDKQSIKKIQNLIIQSAVNDNNNNLLTKAYRVNKLQEKIAAIIKIIFDKNMKLNYDLKKNPVIKTLFNVITEKEYNQITYILNDNISYAILEQVKRHLTNDENNQISLIRFVELAIILGTTFMEWWFDYFFQKPCYLPGRNVDDENLFFKSHCEEHNIIFYSKDIELWVKSRKNLENLPNKAKNIKELQIKIAAKLGSYFLEYFIKENIFEELPIINKVRYLTLFSIYEDDIKMPISFYKPLLDPEISYDKIQLKFYKYRFNFIQKETNQSKYTYNKTAELTKCLKTTDTKYCILKPFFNLYLDYISHMKTIPFTDLIYDPLSENARIITDYIYHTYQLDIQNIILSCPEDEKLIIQLLNYMQSKEIFDTSLAKLFMNNFKKYRKIIIETTDKMIGKEKITNFLFSTGKFLGDYLNNQTQESIDNEKHYSRVTKAKFLWDAYDKVVYNKFFINFFLKDAYFYSHFEHFYLKKDLTGITRIAEKAYFLNYQNHRFARSFIAYFVVNKTLKEQDFNTAKNIFSDVLATTKHKFKDLTYTEYESKTQEMQNEFLSHFFKDTITIKELLEINFTSLLEIITKYKRYFKKANETLYSLSILHYMLNKDKYTHIEPIIVLDSTNSVTQHIANVFKNKLAAHFGCLTGLEYNDLNSYFQRHFNSFIKIKLTEECNKLLKIFDIKDLKNITLKTLYNHFNNFLAMPAQDDFDFNSFFKQIDLYFEENKKEFIFPKLSQDFCTAFFALIQGSTLGLDTQQPFTLKHEIKLRILIILTSYTINEILTQSTWLNNLLESRDIYKPRIMPEAYGMTSMGGYDAVLKAINKKLLEQGQFNVKFSHIKLFTHMISSYFALYFKQKELSYMDDFLALRKFLKYRKENNNLQLSTKYVSWTYTPMKIKTIRLNVARLKTEALKHNSINETTTKGYRRFLNIGYITKQVDTQQLTTSLCVHIIHTQETYVMMNWLITAQTLNQLLKNKLGLDYFYTPNNDCFGTNFKHIVFLRYHIENSYNVCHNDDIIKSLLKMFQGNKKGIKNARQYIMTLVKQQGDPNYWDGTITNKYFVKH